MTPPARYQHGKSLRKQSPRSGHAQFVPAEGRDAVALVEGQNENRLPWLVPVRRERMLASPFAFYRGAAAVIACDLADSPVSGLRVQICGDAHLSNFGMFASPERQLVFDLNDFDETLPGPWEWDVKRLAASFTIAARHREFDDAICRQITTEAVRTYRKAMRWLAKRRTLDVWYLHTTARDILRFAKRRGRAASAKLFFKKAKSRDVLRAHSKHTVEVDGQYRIKSEPPLLVPLRELHEKVERQRLDQLVHESFARYRQTLPDHRQRLMEGFRPVDVALKVVGVGSVGTRCMIMLLEGRDRHDPLFLQMKQATASVLEAHLAPSQYEHHGQRVVEGQRLMQSVGDSFLGWTRSDEGNEYYWRQLRDWKGSPDVDTTTPEKLYDYAYLCGLTLARAHARSGDRIAIAGYLGSGSVFERAVADFAEAYADQNLADHAEFSAAIHSE